MNKKYIVVLVSIISTLIGISLYSASRLSKILDSDILNIEEDDF